MPDIPTQCADLLDSAEQVILDRIASTRRNTRERAIGTLTKSLDPQSETDKVIFQTLPLELMQRGDIIWAIWYIETIAKLGNGIALEVLRQVVEKAIDERMECDELGDVESSHVVDSSILSLFRSLQSYIDTWESSELHLLMGYYQESKWNLYKAIPYYDRAIEEGSIDGYLASARVYEELWEYNSSETVLDVWYALHKDKRLLWPLIRILCKFGKSREAYTKYLELKSQDEGILPFIVYKDRVESDEELREVESIIASYVTEASFMPSEALAELSKCATNYVGEQVHVVNDRIWYLDKKSVDDWSEDEHGEYTELIFRRLLLTQIDVLTLCNTRFVEHYLRDMRILGIDWSIAMRSMLWDFFLSSSSVEVTQEVQVRNKSDSHEGWNFRTNFPNTVYEDLSLHVARVWELFSQPGFYNIQTEQIAPLLEISAVREWEFDHEMESDIHDALWAMKDQADYYYALNSSIRKNYEDFLQSIDKKYGVFYRRHIQTIAINPDFSPEKYPKVLRDYPDIALLFWMEKMIAWQFPTDDPDEIEKIVQLYALDKVNIQDALIFWSLLFDVSIEYSLWFLVDYPNMLDVPEAIYIVTEWLRSMDKKTRKMAIQDLHSLAKERYGARGFFEHIRYTFSDIYKNDPSDEEIASMLLSSGNIVILQNKKRVQAILNFQIAGEQFGSVEGLVQAGDSYEDMWDYDRALDLFEQALLQDDTIRNLIKVLNCAICSSRFDKAEQYIQYGLERWYSIANYVLAFYLWQWNTKFAFLQMIQMIKEKQNIIDTPEWLPKLLFDTLAFVMKMPDLLDQETNILKVHASFILYNISFNWVPIEPEAFLLHWKYVNSLSDSYDGETWYSIIHEWFIPMTWELYYDTMSQESTSDEFLEYLDTHAQNIYLTYEMILDNTEDEKRKTNIRERMNDLCGLAILTLRKFPDSERLVEAWWSKLKFNSPTLSVWWSHTIESTMTYQ